MPVDSVTYVHEVLNDIFMKCDIERTEVVEIDALLDLLISQDPNWQKNELIRIELKNKLLHNNDSSRLITKAHFISSLIEWYESIHSTEKQSDGNKKVGTDEESNSPISSGIGSHESLEDRCGSNHSANYVNFVSDGQTLTNDDFLGSYTDSNSGSPQSLKQFSLIKEMEQEIESLQKKNEYFESVNSSQAFQLSSLEEIITKYEKERIIQVKKFENKSQLLEVHKQKQDELEEKLNKFLDENKSVTIQLSQSERENSKLKEVVSNLEKQIDSITSEKKQQYNKIQGMKDKIKTLTEIQIGLQEELDSLKIKEIEGNKVFDRIINQNKILQSQLDSSVILTQDLKTELTSAHRELSHIKNKLKKRIEFENLPKDISTDNSMVLFDDTISLDTTIPFETSLLAELQDEVQFHKEDCGCLHMKSLSLALSTFSSDAGSSTDKINTSDCGTMTASNKFQMIQDPSMFKDVGVNCSLKSVQNASAEVHCKICILKSKRSLTKWLCLGLSLLLCFILGFVSSGLLVMQYIVLSPKPSYCLSSLFDFLYTKKQTLLIY